MGSGSSSGSSLSVTLRTACSTHHTQGHWKAPKRVRYTYLQLAVCSCRPRAPDLEPGLPAPLSPALWPAWDPPWARALCVYA